MLMNLTVPNSHLANQYLLGTRNLEPEPLDELIDPLDVTVMQPYGHGVSQADLSDPSGLQSELADRLKVSRYTTTALYRGHPNGLHGVFGVIPFRLNFHPRSHVCFSTVYHPSCSASASFKRMVP